MMEHVGIFPRGDKAPADYFTGTAWVSILVPKDSTGSFSVGNVEFEPGSRNNWHTHPAGQILLVIDGEGWYQERGKTARRLAKGDVVDIPADLEHWHGATKNKSLTHIAITHLGPNGPVQWLGRVTDEEYNTID
jgi:4-carboxymuconolactone decarboxylase